MKQTECADCGQYISLYWGTSGKGEGWWFRVPIAQCQVIHWLTLVPWGTRRFSEEGRVVRLPEEVDWWESRGVVFCEYLSFPPPLLLKTTTKQIDSQPTTPPAQVSNPLLDCHKSSPLPSNLLVLHRSLNRLHEPRGTITQPRRSFGSIPANTIDQTSMSKSMQTTDQNL